MENEAQYTRVVPKDLTFHFLEDITKGFSEEHIVGSGGYGVVYKGVLNDGNEIAIKKLIQMVGLDDEQFKNEFNNLMRVQHKNVVQFIGYCYEVRHKHVNIDGGYLFARVEERALCFEYLHGGGLDKHLSDESCGLDWNTRYKIIKGICEGLHYLHTGSKDAIYHLDLKPANILLDNNMTPKIGDFGLSRLFASSATYTTKKFIGTLGYMPPEYIEKRQISPKFDVYSLGVTIIQIITGPLGRSDCLDMPSEEFIELVHRNWQKRMGAMLPHISEEVKLCTKMALRCMEASRVKRPTMTEIVDELNKLDATGRSYTGQSSNYKGYVGVDPMEMRFPFEPNKEISCVLQLTNRTNDSIAFYTNTNNQKYHAHPEEGIIPPCSRLYIILTMRAQKNAPPDMQCNDVFLVYSTTMSKEDLMLDNIVKRFRNMSMIGKVVDEESIPIVYVPLAHCPSR